MEEEKICLNCKYFMQHYIKTNSGLSRTGCGHCVNFSVRKKLTYKDFTERSCERWETAEPRFADLKKAFNLHFKYLVKRIELINYLIDEICGDDKPQ